jgi:hypothetical protein
MNRDGFGVWWMILLASVVYGNSTYVVAALGFPTNLGVE